MAIPGIHKEMTPEIAERAIELFRQNKSLNQVVFLLNYEYAIGDIAGALVTYIERLERETAVLRRYRELGLLAPPTQETIRKLEEAEQQRRNGQICEHGVIGGWLSGDCAGCNELKLAGFPPPSKTTKPNLEEK